MNIWCYICCRLCINLIVVQVCDAYSKVRGIPDEDLPDEGNLYHSIEYAQNDYLQMGQYAEAEKLLIRMQTIIEKVGGAAEWNKTRKLIWVQHRMNARQQIEYLGDGQKTIGPLEWAERVPGHNEQDPHPGTLRIEEDINYAPISEVGMLLVHFLAEVKTCAKDETNDCLSNANIRWALEESEIVVKTLNEKNSTAQDYSKNMGKMMHQVMLAIRDLAEAVRPLGLKCFSDEKCKKKLSEQVIVKPFRKATQIQKEYMIQSSATVTLLYMPSYEVLGYVFLAFENYKYALDMFENSLKEKMGRKLSLLGLARSHLMIGNKEKAKYFYDYLATQLQEADENNPIVAEAMSSDSPSEAKQKWIWPYYLPFFNEENKEEETTDQTGENTKTGQNRQTGKNTCKM